MKTEVLAGRTLDFVKETIKFVVFFIFLVKRVRISSLESKFQTKKENYSKKMHN